VDEGPLVDLGRLTRTSATPLYRQLYERLRASILAGHLPPGTRLPSTRALQAELGVGRNTVADAFSQLLAEGYLETRKGSGTYVARTIPDDLVTLRGASERGRSPHRRRPLSERGRVIVAAPSMPDLEWRKRRPFYPGVPAYELLPIDTWRRLMARHWRRPSAGVLGYGAPVGYEPLRHAIAQHLTAVRGVSCDPGQVIVVAGSQQALDLAARVLLDAGDAAWIEDPAFPGARAALSGAGARLVPVRIDDDGIDVAEGERLASDARLAYVSPSHQYPLGKTMSVARRLELLRWAEAHGAWIVEDDYDSEFRYRGRVLPALKGLDEHGWVIYVGTFSKVLFPSLRLGYMVVPDDLVDAFAAARALSDRHPPTAEQAVLADFITDGHFLRHIRRMRLVYAERQAVLLEHVGKRLGGLLEVEADEAGMHVIGRLPQGADDVALSLACAGRGVSAPPLSHYYMGEPAQPGFVLGYTGYDEPAINWGVRMMGHALAP